MENSADPGPSSSAESSQEGTSSTRKRRLHMSCQQSGCSGYLPCKYCPFGTSDRNSLIAHEQRHHVARLRSKCTYCTYSSKNSLSVANHINRVHREQLLKSQSKDVFTAGSSCSTRKGVDTVQEMMNEVRMQPNIERDVTIGPSGVEQEDDLSLQNEPVQTNDTTKISKEVVVIDITMESDDEETQEVVMGVEEMSCLCSHPQNVIGNSFMVRCDNCKSGFHGTCVGITLDQSKQMDAEGKKWLCPQCVHKRSIIIHKEKFIQMVNTSVNLFPPTLITTSSSTPPPDLSKDDGFDPQSQEPNCSDASEPPSLSEPSPALSKKEEEHNCRSDLSKLELELNSAQEMLLKLEKSASAERLARSKKAIELRKMIEEDQSKDRLKSTKQDLLVKLRERFQTDFQQHLKELTAQKSQLEQEIYNLRIISTGKRIKVEPNSASNLADVDFGAADMQQKKQLLSNVKEKLAAIKEEDTHLGLRIQEVEQEKMEITLNITKMRTDLDSLEASPATGSPLSVIAVQMKSLKREQRARIQNFASLEKKLVQISCDYVLDAIDAIRRKKEEQLNALKEDGE